MGMNSSDVREVQNILYKSGYTVDPTGIFDEPTFHEIVKLQKEFGLVTNGIIGPMTRALLYLMS